jgi:hypothetical protein
MYDGSLAHPPSQQTIHIQHCDAGSALGATKRQFLTILSRGFNSRKQFVHLFNSAQEAIQEESQPRQWQPKKIVCAADQQSVY